MVAENENAFDFKIPSLLQRSQSPLATMLNGDNAPIILIDHE